MAIEERIHNLRDQFASFSDWEARYSHLISLGKKLDPYPEKFRLEENKVKGCQSQVWLYAEFKDGLLLFYGDSDASIVKGIIAVLLSVYNQASPGDILKTSPQFLEDIGLKQHLSMSRANGLSAMVKQISFYALAYKAKSEMGV